MKIWVNGTIYVSVLTALCLCPIPTGAQAPSAGITYTYTVPSMSNDYPLSKDSLPQPGVVPGKTFQFLWTESRVFPGTKRTITVYVPDAYRPSQPACVYIGLDALGFNAAVVFDNLITQHAMPITIGIGVSPGVVSADGPDNPRFDRSMEFDDRSGRLADFLLTEILPEVQRRLTPKGDPIRLSTNPNDRAIGGGSTGGIAAFNAAWQRPEAFHRVFTAVGTFVGMRGGEQFYVEVRKTEPKPMRIFQEDGVHDEWMGGPEVGDWWMSNLTMNRALRFAGYDVTEIWGTGNHNGSHASAIFPEAMRWLWRDYPSPILAGKPGNPVLADVLLPGEEWHEVAAVCNNGAQLSTNKDGELFYDGVPLVLHQNQSIQLAPDCSHARPRSAVAYDGETPYEARKEPSEGAVAITLPDDLQVQYMTVLRGGDIIASASTQEGSGELWLVRRDGTKRRLDTGLRGVSGLAPSPDGKWLFVAQRSSHLGLSYRILHDGTLDSRESLYYFHVPADADDPGAEAAAMDRAGRPYVATRSGVQIFDRNGRVTGILPIPNHAPATALCFGGTNFNTLYVAAGGKIFARKLRVRGDMPWDPKVSLPPWTAG